MGLRALLPGIRSEDLAAAAALPAPMVPVGLQSPWTPSPALAQVLGGTVFADVFGPTMPIPVTRAEAIQVPAVARARHVIAGTVARIPLHGYRRGQLLPDTDVPWIASTSATTAPYHRLLWTADDLLFYGWSCWSRTNGADGYPLRMDRIPMGRWGLDEVGRVTMPDAQGVHQLVDQRTVVLIPGPHEGILTAAAGTIRHAADLQRAAAQAARHPAAYLYLRQVSGSPLKHSSTDPEEVTVTSTVADWHAAREGLNGGVAFVPLGLEVGELGTFDAHLLTEGRNAAAVDVARVCSLPADLLDAAGPSSLTYATTRDNDQRAIQYGVGLYLSAISAALSQTGTGPGLGVTPLGQEVRFDLESWLEDPTQAAPATPGVVSRETTPAPVPPAPVPSASSPVGVPA